MKLQSNQSQSPKIIGGTRASDAVRLTDRLAGQLAQAFDGHDQHNEVRWLSLVFYSLGCSIALFSDVKVNAPWKPSLDIKPCSEPNGEDP